MAAVGISSPRHCWHKPTTTAYRSSPAKHWSSPATSSSLKSACCFYTDIAPAHLSLLPVCLLVPTPSPWEWTSWSLPNSKFTGVRADQWPHCCFDCSRNDLCQLCDKSMEYVITSRILGNTVHHNGRVEIITVFVISWHCCSSPFYQWLHVYTYNQGKFIWIIDKN